MTLQIKLILLGVIALLASGGVLYWNLHEQHKGEAKCEQKDLDAANKQIAALTAERDRYKTQLSNADAQHTADLDIIARAAAATPIGLMCHETASHSVPKVPGPPSGSPIAPGPASDVRAADFDPSADLLRLSVGYERRVESYRDALNRWPHD